MAIDIMTTADLIDVLETVRLTPRQLVVALDELQARANAGDGQAQRYFEIAESAMLAEFN